MRQTVFQTRILDRSCNQTRNGNKIEFFHSRESVANMEREVNGLVLKGSNPKTIEEFRNVYYVPGNDCLFDSEGEQILISCVRRGKNLSEVIDAPLRKIAVPSDYTTLVEPILYLSSFPHHWGHFITEGISRCWPFLVDKAFSDLKGFYCRATFFSQAVEFLACFGLHPDRNIIANLTRPVKIERCFVPTASFSNRGEAYEVHSKVLKHVTVSTLGDAPKVLDTPVYLSRTKMNTKLTRNISREFLFEQSLEQRGVKIVHPEFNTLDQQIRLFNSHTNFIGTWGSAFHGMPFRNCGGPSSTHVAADGFPNINYLMFDAFEKYRPVYVDCMRPNRSLPQTWPLLNTDFDTELFSEHLNKELGLAL